MDETQTRFNEVNSFLGTKFLDLIAHTLGIDERERSGGSHKAEISSSFDDVNGCWY